MGRIISLHVRHAQRVQTEAQKGVVVMKSMLDFALRNPITVMVLMIAIAMGSVFAVTPLFSGKRAMRTDVFPDLNMPVIYVAQAYGGMDSAQMEGYITNYYELAFLYCSGVEHVESKNIQNMALVKIFFHPGTNMAQAMAETAIFANRAKAFFPPGTVTPFIFLLDASSVPVCYLTLSSETHSIDELSDLLLFRVRPVLASLPGTSSPMPFGGSMRTIVVYLDPERLRSYQISPQDVVSALNSGNVITPSGNARIKDQMLVVSINSVVVDPKDLGNIPVKPEKSIYLRDLGRVEDTSDIPLGWALINGRRAVYMPINKASDASTLTVANNLRAKLDYMRSILPEDVKLEMAFDQSPHVTGAVGGVIEESVLGAILTGLMVLLFLRDWRSVIVVVLTIPLALMGAILGLWITGQTINLMTLGGLSLAVGILVDEATVVIENIHTQMGKRSSTARAILIGTAETVTPNLLAMLSVLAVFMPSFLMEGAARGLFVPLAIAVSFAMSFAFLLSITFVPVMSAWLLRHAHTEHHGRVIVKRRPLHWLMKRLPFGHAGAAGQFTFARFLAHYVALLRRLLTVRKILIPCYLAVAVVIVVLVGGQVGREIAPQVDSGQFQLRMRMPSGTRLEVSEDATRKVLDVVNDVVGKDKVEISVSYVGVTAPTYTANAVFMWTTGTDQSIIRVALKHHSGLHLDEVKRKLREELPAKVTPWLTERLEHEGYARVDAQKRAETIRFSFEAADVINQVMSFGSSTPIEILVRGPNLAQNRAYANKLFAKLNQVPSLRDLVFAQNMDYPRVQVDVDRERAGLAGVTVADASNAMIAATSSSRYIVPIYWADPKSGIGYQVQIEVPPERINSVEEVGMIPVQQLRKGQLLLRDIGTIKATTMPEEYDRINQLRYLSITANLEGEDLGRVSNHIDDAIKEAGEPPRGTTVDVAGQVPPMLQMFNGLTKGLVLAVVAVFLMLTAYFQSVRLALVATATAPAVVAGVSIALYVTHSTLNIESFMGAIMAVGVAVANAIILVTFAERSRTEGGAPALHAAQIGAQERLRPILMTSCAMIAGMVPMALGMGEGGEQTAPLGRAVIGGLGVGTLCTLFVLPAVFAVVMSDTAQSPSLHPDDPDSNRYDEQTGEVAADGHGHGESGHDHGHGPAGAPEPAH
jgi:multidrug efflux pump subunit AcrB